MAASKAIKLHPPNQRSEPHPPNRPSEPHPHPDIIRSTQKSLAAGDKGSAVQTRDGPGDPSTRVAKDHTPNESSHPDDLNDDVPSNQETDEDLLIEALQRLDMTTPQTTAPPTLAPRTTQEATPSDSCTQLYAYQSPPRSAGVRHSVGVGPVEGGRGPQLEDDFIGESQHENLTTSDVSGPGEEDGVK